MSYINTEKFKERLDASPLFANFGEDGIFIRDFVRGLVDGESTADVVEVVRCGECRHCKYNSSADKYKCDRRGYFTETVEVTDYCSVGERREG